MCFTQYHERSYSFKLMGSQIFLGQELALKVVRNIFAHVDRRKQVLLAFRAQPQTPLNVASARTH